jgi:isopentenyl-diphosphate Delta-isomerase
MLSVGQGMLVDVVNANDTPVGVIARAEVFRKRANFRVAHDLIFNTRGELLVQKLAATRFRHPGYWGSSVAAYLFAGESYLAAAERRLTQELGVRGLKLDFVGKISMNDDGCQKFVGIFSAVHDGPFSSDKEEIEKLEFLSLQQIHHLHHSGERLFTPTFLTVLSYYESRIQ